MRVLRLSEKSGKNNYGALRPKRRNEMPVITFEGPALPIEKKERLAREITQIATDITNIPKDAFIIFIKENPYENMAKGGVLLSEQFKKQ